MFGDPLICDGPPPYFHFHFYFSLLPAGQNKQSRAKSKKKNKIRKAKCPIIGKSDKVVLMSAVKPKSPDLNLNKN